MSYHTKSESAKKTLSSVFLLLGVLSNIKWKNSAMSLHFETSFKNSVRSMRCRQLAAEQTLNWLVGKTKERKSEHLRMVAKCQPWCQLLP